MKDNEKIEQLRKKLLRLERKRKKHSRDSSSRDRRKRSRNGSSSASPRPSRTRSRSPPSSRRSSPSPTPSRPPTPSENDGEIHTVDDEQLPPELLEALGEEGQDISLEGQPIHIQLTKRWTKIIEEGLTKEERENIAKKYPLPLNFKGGRAPTMNPEIAAALSEPSIKRDKRLSVRQNMMGSILSCLGQALSNIMKGDISSKSLVEQMNDAAKLAAEAFHQDSSSRKFFALAGANKTVQDAVKNTKPDDFLFGKDCAEKIKAAQALEKTSIQIRTKNKDKKENWRSPRPTQQRPRGSGGQYKGQPRRRSPLKNFPRKQYPGQQKYTSKQYKHHQRR